MTVWQELRKISCKLKIHALKKDLTATKRARKLAEKANQKMRIMKISHHEKRMEAELSALQQKLEQCKHNA